MQKILHLVPNAVASCQMACYVKDLQCHGMPISQVYTRDASSRGSRAIAWYWGQQSPKASEAVALTPTKACTDLATCRAVAQVLLETLKGPCNLVIYSCGKLG